jgi:PKD repeat protein
MNRATRFFLGLVLLTGVACTVKDTPAPPLTGPSGLALSISVTAIPDSILQDGASQTAIQIEAIGPDGRPVRGLTLRVEVEYLGVIEDFGTLSAKTVVTGEDGRARVTYTAPPRPSQQVDEANIVTIHVTPIGSDYRGSSSRTVDLRLVTPGVLLPPNAAPVAQFTSTPTPAAVMTNVIFDASTSTDEGVPCGSACSYTWDFGDATSGTGVFVTHSFRTSGVFQVRLTVSDARGASGSSAVPMTIGGGTPPTVTFTVSPSTPAVNQTVFFNAEGARAATGRRLVSYDWSFGNGRTSSGVTAQQSYGTAGSYAVTLTVTDDAGGKTTVSQSVTVAPTGTGPGTSPTASFTYSPTSPSVNQMIFFNATSSTTPAGTTFTSATWDFGDGTTASGATPTHAFAGAATYVVRLTVTNSAGQTATTTQTVSVSAAAGGTGLTPRLTVSPNPGNTATDFVFDASTSTAGSSPIASYLFRFGDGTPDVTTTSPSTTHRYAANGNYTATVTLRDNANSTATSPPVAVTVAIALQARLTVTPSTGNTSTSFFFDARASTPGPDTFIVSYRFTFGDGTFVDSPSPTVSHTYATPGTYTATVTIRDNGLPPATSTAAVTVPVSP